MQRVMRDKRTFVFDRRLEPVATVRLDEQFLVETEDSKGGSTRTRETATRDNLLTLRNRGWLGLSLTGPIYVEGAEPGDLLAVHIHEQKCDPVGYTSFWPEWFHLESLFNGPGMQLYEIQDGRLIFNDKIRIPIRPMIGCMGTTPAVEAILGKHGGTHGGNLDVPEICAASTVYLPVFVEGALLALGDCHAIQSDGEMGTLEVRSEVVLSCSVLKGRGQAVSWPRIVTPDSIVTVGVGSPLDEAINVAVREMILWVEELTGLSREDSYRLVGFVGQARPGNAQDRLPFTMRVIMPRAYLPMVDDIH